jgi:hypothetical protein
MIFVIYLHYSCSCLQIHMLDLLVQEMCITSLHYMLQYHNCVHAKKMWNISGTNFTTFRTKTKVT